MKKGFIITILFFINIFCFAQENQGIKFSDLSWNEVLHKAKKEEKAIFLYAYTPSCHFCRQMEKEVFTDKKVADFYNANFLSYRINIEDGGGGEALAKEYNIIGFPTYLYFDKNGVLLHQSGSAKPAADFIRNGQNAFNPQVALFYLKGKYDSGVRSSRLLYNYGNALAYYHNADSPEETVVSEYLKTQSSRELKSEKNLTYIFEKNLSFHSPATQYFIKNQRQFISLFGESNVRDKTLKLITRTTTIAGRDNNLPLLNEVKQVISENFEDTIRLSLLATIYFYQGQQEWLKYAQATSEYSNTQSGNDWQTLYETAIYLNTFTKDKEALEIGAQIMQKVLDMNRSYDNLYLSAQLWQNAGRNDLALEACRDAIIVANKAGEQPNEAEKLISEIKAIQEK